MALFSGKVKREEIEEEIKKKLSHNSMIDALVEEMINNNNAERAWLHIGQDYYDSCERIVRVDKDGISIKESEAGHFNESSRTVSKIGYRYVDHGFVPLHAYKSSDNTKQLPLNRVCHLLALTIKEKLEKNRPDFKCGEVSDETSEASRFRYKVPALPFEEWF